MKNGYTAALLFVAAAAVAAAAPACSSPGAPPRPNIVLLTIDTLRADHLEVYGHHRATAPALARLAERGVRFSHAVSQAPWTLPAMASLHSSLYPIQHGADAAGRALPETAETLAERLEAIGYHTVAVVSNEFVSTKHGFDQGFEIFDESNVRGHEAVTSRDLTLTALASLNELGEPFFLWVHYFDPHFTYVRHADYGFADGYAGELPDQLTSGRLVQEQRLPMSAEDLDYIRAVYDEEIAHTDAWVEVLLQGLEDRYGDDDNVFIVTSDHGEYFLERGRFFHGKDVYGELVDVPLIIAGAIDERLRGAVVDDVVETRSIPLTVIGLLGLSAGGFAGIDLLEAAPSSAGPTAVAESSHAFGADERKVAVVHGGWKLIHRLDDDAYELYDLVADPAERHDRYAELGGQDDRVVDLMGRLQELRSLPRLAPRTVNLTPEAVERLRALGYVR